MENAISTRTETVNRNEDPITHEPGAHPVSTGVGAVGGGVTGATIGMAVSGPVGGAIGAVIGAIVGGWGGSAVGEAIDPTLEEEYWRDKHSSQPHATQETEYASFEPAYRVGYEGYDRHGGGSKSFEEVESNLRGEYESGGARLEWAQARDAAHAAWTRVHDSRVSRGMISDPVEIAYEQKEAVFEEPSHEVIASRAWEIYQAEGCQDGHDLEHWLRAERETLRSAAPSAA
ncbi:MAG: DUF2934 domain-containing protein [Verrucomicrobiota bacterium]